MATAYTSLLGLALPVTGELSGTWGDTVNNSITSLLDSAVAGTTTISSDADVTLTTTTGASNTSREAILLWTAGGTVTRTITAPAQSKTYIVINKTSSTQSIKLVGAGPTTGVTIVAGESAVCAWNGSDFVKVANQNGIGNFTTLNATTVDTTNIEVTNIKAKDGTASVSLADSTGIATFSKATVVETTDNTNAALRITQLGTGNALLVEDSANPDSSPFVIDSAGAAILGTTASATLGLTGQQLQVQTVAGISGAGALFAGWNATQPNAINLARSQSGTIGTNGVVSSGAASSIRFFFDDGTNFIRGAAIDAVVDGTPGTNDMPGRLVFSTTADGASSPTEAMRIGSAQTVSIGSSGTVAGVTLNISKTITGSTTSYAMRSVGQVQSDVTSNARYYATAPSTQATAFTLGSLTHYYAEQGTFGAGSTVTNQYGFVTASSLTGATNNYGFYGNIASATGAYNFYAAGTADNYFAGNLLRGYTSAVATTTYANFSLTPPLQTHGSSAGNSSIGLFNWSSSGGSTSSFVFSKSLSGVVGTRGALTAAASDLGNIAFSGDDGTNFINAANILVETDGTPGVNAMPGRFSFYTTRGGVYSISTVVRTSNTVTLVATARMNVVVGDTIVVAGVTDTGFNGTFTIATLVGTTITYAQTAANASSSGGTVTAQSTTAVERVRIDSAGNVGIGSTSITNTALRISKNITGSITSYALYLDGSVQADVTSNAYGIRTTPATQATSFTLPNLFHFNANQGTFGAGSTVTNQFGFTVDNSLTGATNNYGFYGDIASGTGRWNLYMSGTANNYMAGNVGIGTTAPLTALNVNGTGGELIRISVTADGATIQEPALGFATGVTNTYPATKISALEFDASDSRASMLFYTRDTNSDVAPTERMRIDSSGNVGIGTTSPASKLEVASPAATPVVLRLASNKTGTGAGDKGRLDFYSADNSGIAYQLGYMDCDRSDGTGTASYIAWANRVSGTVAERMRIDSSGNLLVGTTNSNSNSFKLKVQAATDVCVGLASATSISGALTFNVINDANSANIPVDFRCNGFYISNGLATGAGTNAVKFNTTTKQLTYDTSSARYKNNIRDSIYGLDHVMQMRSAQFEYKDTGNSDVGLIAEEMQPIIPELVGLNEEGLADSVSYDRMVSVLVKAIQELKAINDTQAETINALTARIVALESN